MFTQFVQSPNGPPRRKDYPDVHAFAKEVLEKLIAKGAKFYNYHWYHVMYIKDYICTLDGNASLRSVMRFNLDMPDCDCKPSVVESVRTQARALCVDIPEGVIGRVNNLKEPKRSHLRQPNQRIQNWLKAVIESNKLGDQ